MKFDIVLNGRIQIRTSDNKSIIGCTSSGYSLFGSRICPVVIGAEIGIGVNKMKVTTILFLHYFSSSIANQ